MKAAGWYREPELGWQRRLFQQVLLLHLLMFMGRVTKQNRKMRQWKGHIKRNCWEKRLSDMPFPGQAADCRNPCTRNGRQKKQRKRAACSLRRWKKAEKKWGNTLPRWNSQRRMLFYASGRKGVTNRLMLRRRKGKKQRRIPSGLQKPLRSKQRRYCRRFFAGTGQFSQV